MRKWLISLWLLVAAPALASDGFFTVGQADGRWWFFTPEGEIFFSTGVNVVSPGGYYSPDCNCSPYHDNIIALYGSEDAWADVTRARLAEWNFNTLGGWSDADLFDRDIPFAPVLYLSGADWQYGIVPDFWDEAFYERVEQNTNVCEDLADEPNLLGYYIDNEMRWGLDPRRFADLFTDYLGLPPGAPGKLELQAWLEERYDGDLFNFNRYYGMELRSWGQFQKVMKVSPVPRSERQADDREAWVGYVADHFFAVTTAAIRAKDPNHLVLGARFISWITPRAVLAAAAPYLDVVSVNHYMVWEPYQWIVAALADEFRFVSGLDMLAEFNEMTDKPVLITEFAFRGLDAVPPSTWPPRWLFMTAPDQTQRTEWMLDYTQACVAAPYCIGYHWFAYMDEPAAGRFDGEDSNFGLVDEQDAPYDQLVDAFTAVNISVYPSLD